MDRPGESVTELGSALWSLKFFFPLIRPLPGPNAGLSCGQKVFAGPHEVGTGKN